MCLHRRLTRRSAIGLVLGAVATAQAGARAAEAAGPYDGPFVDAHTHIKETSTPPIDELMAIFDGAGVRGVQLFGEPWQLASEARRAYPTRVVPFLQEGYANALHPHSSYVNHGGLGELLEAQVVRGLGEMILRHSPYQLGAAGGFASAPANNVPADHPSLVDAYRLAARHGAPVNVHQEWFSPTSWRGRPGPRPRRPLSGHTPGTGQRTWCVPCWSEILT